MSSAVNPILRQVSRPYLTLDEFKNAPTALDYGNLVQGGNEDAQDAELSNAITRASSFIDSYCNQILAATADVEQQRVRVRPDGTIRFHPKYWPVVALTDLKVGWYPNVMTTVPDPSMAWLEEQEVVFPISGAQLNWSSEGPLGFGFPSSSRAETYIKYSYVNGYSVTTLHGAASVGATSIVVNEGVGVVPGEMLTIFDGAKTESVTVDSSYTFGSSTIPLTSGLVWSHDDGVAVSSLPAAVKQAAIVMTSAFLKIRGDASLVMAVTTRPSQQIEGAQRIGSDIALAQEILKPFRRIR